MSSAFASCGIIIAPMLEAPDPLFGPLFVSCQLGFSSFPAKGELRVPKIGVHGIEFLSSSNQLRRRLMRHRSLALAFVLLFTGLAAASDQSDVMAKVNQFIEGFNKGDVKMALGACADQAFIIDEFPPHQWAGLAACSAWATDYEADAKKNGVTDGVVTLGKPRHVDITGDLAYLVIPANYSFKQHGKAMKEVGSTLTVVLKKGSAGWLITSWAWSKQ
jgi:ketosteroid isomerase-like protein